MCCLIGLLCKKLQCSYFCVNAGRFGAAPRISTQYMALFDNIIHHMRFPKFIAIVNEELGKEVGWCGLHH